MVIQYIFKKIPDPDSMSLSDHDYEDEDPVEISYDDPVNATCKAIYENPFNDIMIHSKFLDSQGRNVQSEKAQGRTKDDDGNIIGTFDSNPI